MNSEDLLNELSENIFMKAMDSPTKLLDTSGAYLICAKGLDILPEKMKKLEFIY